MNKQKIADIIIPFSIFLANLLVAYILHFFSLIIAIGWFFFATGFQSGKWYGEKLKEDEYIVKEINDKYSK